MTGGLEMRGDSGPSAVEVPVPSASDANGIDDLAHGNPIRFFSPSDTITYVETLQRWQVDQMFQIAGFQIRQRCQIL